MKSYKKARVEQYEHDPDSYQSERNIISAILQTNAAAAAYCSELSESDFSDGVLGVAFTCASTMRLRGEAVDLETLAFSVAHELQDKVSDIKLPFTSALLSLQSAAHDVKASVEGWSKIVKACAIKRHIGEAGQALLDVIADKNISTEEKLEKAGASLNAATKAASTKAALISSAEMMRRTLKASDNTKASGDVPGLSTGLRELDEVLGGMKPSELIIVAARPAMGKTAFALGSVIHAAAVDQRKNVLFVSLEMGVMQLGPRWLSRLTGISSKKIVEGSTTEEESRLLRAAALEHKDVVLEIDETPVMSLMQIANRARQMHQEIAGGLDMLVIDYLQLIQDSGRQGASQAERVGEISKGLKQLARELKIPVIALSQLNRKLEERQDKRPLMSDLRDSGAIEQDADVILFLYRDSVYNKNSPDADRAEIIIGKNRGGSNYTVFAKFCGSETRFSDYESTRSTTAIDYDSLRSSYA